MLSNRQQLFIVEYMKDLNATKAAARAGYSPRSAQVAGSRLLSNDIISREIAKRQNKVISKLEVTAERIIQERARLAFFDPRKLLDISGRPKPLHELDDDTAAAIAGLKVSDRYERPEPGAEAGNISTVLEYKLADKNASLTALEKINGLYKNSDEPSGVLNIFIHNS